MKTINYWDVLNPDKEEVEKIILGLCSSFPEIFKMIIPNLTASSFTNILDFLKIFTDQLEIENVKLYAEETDHFSVENNIFLKKEVFYFERGYSIESIKLFEMKNCEEKEFLLFFLSYMENIGYPLFSHYYNYQYEILSEMLKEDSEEDSEEIEIIKETFRIQLKAASLISHDVNYRLIKVRYKLLKDKTPFEYLMQIASIIKDDNIKSYSFQKDDEVEFDAAFTIHYSYDNKFAESYIEEIDENVNNYGITKSSVLIKLGEEPDFNNNFNYFIELIEVFETIINKIADDKKNKV